MDPLHIAEPMIGAVVLKDLKGKNNQKCKNHMTGHEDQVFKVEEEGDCELCLDMDRKEAARTHALIDCFANPNGRKFRERVWKLRKREYERKGIPLPKLM